MASVLKVADASKLNANSQNSIFEMKILSIYSEMIQLNSVVITNINIWLIFPSRDINAKLGAC